MGLRPSSLIKPKVSLTWVLKSPHTKHKERSGVRRVSGEQQPRNCLPAEGPVVGGSGSSGGVDVSRRCRYRQRRSRSPRHHQPRCQHFGYQITDLDAFLSKASIETPGNIPVVLSSPCLLYQTHQGVGAQQELPLPLGMVVNAVFKNRGWLYVQTPHGDEGYVRYASCLPLGILPPPDGPRWESNSDVFPKPTGGSRCGGGSTIQEGTRSECGSAKGGNGKVECGEENVDWLYLAATRSSTSTTERRVLLVIDNDYSGRGRNTLSVNKGDVVSLVNSEVRDWFWVRTRDGREGFIPAVVAGHGFL